MRTLSWIAVAGLLSAAAVAAAIQEGDDSKDRKAKDDTAKEAKARSGADAALAALYPSPTEVHKKLVENEQGVWDSTMKGYFSGPDQPPQEFKGVETVRVIADGLFVVTEFEADFVGGKKFKGHGITGYDVQKKKMVGAWADNMATSIGTLSGDFDPKNKTVTLWFELADQTTGQMRKDKHVIEYKGAGHKVYTIYGSQGGGEAVKLMEIESKRRADAAESKMAEKKAAEKKEEKE